MNIHISTLADIENPLADEKYPFAAAWIMKSSDGRTFIPTGRGGLAAIEDFSLEDLLSGYDAFIAADIGEPVFNRDVLCWVYRRAEELRQS